MRGRPKVRLKEYITLIIFVAVVATIFPLAMAQSGNPVSGGGSVLAPTGAGLESNTCFECHSDSSKVEDTSFAEEWKDSVHAENNIGCERCHSASVPAGRLARFDVFGGSYRDDHVDLVLEEDIAYKAPSAFEIEGQTGEYSLAVRGGLKKQQSVAMCARCHGLTEITPDSPKNVFPDYLSSVHGQSVVVGGLGDPARVGQAEVEFEVTGELGSAVCTDCHNAHATKSKDDPTSETYKDNVVKVCAGEDCHASNEVADKFDIVNAVETYEKSPHGKAAKFGVEGIPNCIDCHVASSGSHKILSKDNPESDVHPNNVAEICANEDCHNMEFNVGSGSLHGKDTGTTIGNLIDLFYWIIIPLVVGFFALYIVLDLTLMLGKKGGK